VRAADGREAEVEAAGRVAVNKKLINTGFIRRSRKRLLYQLDGEQQLEHLKKKWIYYQPLKELEHRQRLTRKTIL